MDDAAPSREPDDAPLPCLTADLPGIGGVLKQRVEDFEVEEIPAYLPEGQGEFLYLWVEKRGLSAEQMTSHLARALGIAHQDVGTAGLKDRQAVTRQQVSVPIRCAPLVASLNQPGLTVLKTAPHGNKLRSGHLKGNRFAVLLRDVQPDAAGGAEPIRERITRLGFPNYYGEQRFGRENETLRLGFDLLAGRTHPGRIPRARRKFLLRLALSAAQSELFNQALVRRLQDGLLHRVLPGDVMQVVASGGKFVVEDAGREQARFDAHEIVTTGPMFGPKMTQPQGEVAEREASLLREANVEPSAFREFGKLTSGTRRPYLVWPDDLTVAAESDGLRFRFTLPSGTYATVLLREFMKSG
jgi:tRNA pseudouridine13 synthase